MYFWSRYLSSDSVSLKVTRSAVNTCEVDDAQILLIGSILFYFTLIQIVLELVALFILYLLLYSLIFHMAQNHILSGWRLYHKRKLLTTKWSVLSANVISWIVGGEGYWDNLKHPNPCWAQWPVVNNCQSDELW